MGKLVGERRRETEKERERRGSETDVPKLYTYNEFEYSVLQSIAILYFFSDKVPKLQGEFLVKI